MKVTRLQFVCGTYPEKRKGRIWRNNFDYEIEKK